jgi:GTP-binding protein EngB required for normal cell division
MKSSRKKSLTRTSSTRSLRSKTSTEDELSPTIITRPVAQLIDGMSNFFLPKKDKINNSQRQQSIQKAMKYLRNKTSKSKSFPSSSSPTRKNQLLARSILASSKTERLRKKPVILTDESSSK